MEGDPPPPRLSKAYMFGLSSKPWKDPPKPAPLNSWKGMTSTPGAALEWVASDGRKGALIGKSKLRGLKVASGAEVAADGPSNPRTGPRVTVHRAAKTGGNEAKQDTSGQTNNAGELEYKKVPNEAWTDDQDKILFRMKVEQKTWVDIIKELGKTKQECITRWKEIMPDGFYQNKGKCRDKATDQGRYDKCKDKEQKKENEQRKSESKTPSVADAIGVAGWDMFATENEKSTTSDQKSKNDNKDNNSGVVKAGWGDTNEWNNTTGKDTGGTPAWDNSDNNGNGNGWNNWDNNNNGDAVGGFLNNSTGNDGAKENRKGEEKGGKASGKGENSDEKDGNGKQDTSAAGSQLTNDNDWGDAVGDRGANDNIGSEAKKSNGKGSNKSGGKSREKNQSVNNLKVSGGWDKADGDGFGGQSWGNDNKGPEAPSGWGNGNEGPTWGGAASPKKSSHKDSSKDHKKHRSERYSSRHGSEYKDKHKPSDHHSRSRPAEYKISPDDTFSQDELKIIARILQQDSSMVWERVSWRFKERTGRNLHPDVFEKKITGRSGKKQH